MCFCFVLFLFVCFVFALFLHVHLLLYLFFTFVKNYLMVGHVWLPSPNINLYTYIGECHRCLGNTSESLETPGSEELQSEQLCAFPGIPKWLAQRIPHLGTAEPLFQITRFQITTSVGVCQHLFPRFVLSRFLEGWMLLVALGLATRN